MENFILQPTSETVPICYDCIDETEFVVSVENDDQETFADSLIQAYPNPFNNQTTIKISLPNSFKDKNVSYKICNMLGQVVRSFDASDFADKSKFQLVWDGTNNQNQAVCSGNYLFVAMTPSKQYSIKLTFIK